MAITISISPTNLSVNSTLDNIKFQCSEGSADTTNLVATLQYWDGAAWQLVSMIRMVHVLGFAGTFKLDVASLYNSLPQGNFIYDYPSLGMGACYSGSLNFIPEKNFVNVKNWKCRVYFQREYLDAVTNLIVLGPIDQISNEFFIHRGKLPIVNSYQGTISGSGSGTCGLSTIYNHVQTTYAADQDAYGFNWLTDCPITAGYFKSNPFVGNIIQGHRVTIKPTEQYYISNFLGRKSDPSHANTYLTITTYGVDGTQLGNHTHTYSTSAPAVNTGKLDGYITVDVGFRTLVNALTPNGLETTDLANVAYYYVVSQVAGAAAATQSVWWRFDVDRSCIGIGYQRFAWKNQLGAYDFFTSNGNFKKKTSIKKIRYQKSMDTVMDYEDFGINNYQNEVKESFDVLTHDLNHYECNWIAKIANSSMVYVRVELDGKNNPYTYSNSSINETRRDAGACNVWMPIIIESKSIQIFKSSNGTEKVKFKYTWAVPETYPNN